MLQIGLRFSVEAQLRRQEFDLGPRVAEQPNWDLHLGYRLEVAQPLNVAAEP